MPPGTSQVMNKHASQPDVKYFVINLPNAWERRHFMLEQAAHFGLQFNFVPAIAGRELTDEERSHYDREKRNRCMVGDLSDNEIACTLSHRKALKAFLDSGAAYGVTLEDDSLLMPHFTAAIDELVYHLRGWEVAKLYTCDGKLYPLMNRRRCKGAIVHAVLPKKIMWGSLAYMYTQRGARVVYERLETFWRPSDAQIGEILLRERVPAIGVTPSPVGLSELNDHSCIDADARGRSGSGDAPFKKRRRSFVQYCRYRFHVTMISCKKLGMRRLMRRLLRREGI